MKYKCLKYNSYWYIKFFVFTSDDSYEAYLAAHNIETQCSLFVNIMAEKSLSEVVLQNLELSIKFLNAFEGENV